MSPPDETEPMDPTDAPGGEDDNRVEDAAAEADAKAISSAQAAVLDQDEIDSLLGFADDAE